MIEMSRTDRSKLPYESLLWVDELLFKILKIMF